jgi:hypothetical protein
MASVKQLLDQAARLQKREEMIRQGLDAPSADKLRVNSYFAEPLSLGCPIAEGLDVHYSQNGINVLWGSPAAGKTLFCLAAVKQYLTKHPDGRVVWFDCEKGLQLSRLSMLTNPNLFFSLTPEQLARFDLVSIAENPRYKSLQFIQSVIWATFGLTESTVFDTSDEEEDLDLLLSEGIGADDDEIEEEEEEDVVPAKKTRRAAPKKKKASAKKVKAVKVESVKAPTMGKFNGLMEACAASGQTYTGMKHVLFVIDSITAIFHVNDGDSLNTLDKTPVYAPAEYKLVKQFLLQLPFVMTPTESTMLVTAWAGTSFESFGEKTKLTGPTALQFLADTNLKLTAKNVNKIVLKGAGAGALKQSVGAHVVVEVKKSRAVRPKNWTMVVSYKHGLIAIDSFKLFMKENWGFGACEALLGNMPQIFEEDVMPEEMRASVESSPDISLNTYLPRLLNSVQERHKKRVADAALIEDEAERLKEFAEIRVDQDAFYEALVKVCKIVNVKMEEALEEEAGYTA